MASSSDLASLLTSSRALTSHLSRPDLPSINLGLDQIEAQSRRLVSRQPGVTTDNGKANYLLAQAKVDAGSLATSIAALNTTTTFSALQPLHDTDVSGYLRHAHEQSVISGIEEGRRETQAEFYRVLDERARRDWNTRKKRIFEEIGGRAHSNDQIDLRKSSRALASSTTATFMPTLHTHTKMMAYDHVIGAVNTARLARTSYPIIHGFTDALTTTDPEWTQMHQTFKTLELITQEPPALPPIEHATAHIRNAPMLEHKFQRAYFGDPESRDAVELRKRIAQGAREALELQYQDVVERTIQANPTQANLGGDPTVENRIRAFLTVRFYRGGQWEDKLELIAGQAVWAKIFFMIRIGHASEALTYAQANEAIINQRERNFVIYLKSWVESPDRKLPKAQRDRLQSTFNSHILHSPTTDPFKLALFKLMGKIDPTRRTVPIVTATTEDWLWFQLAMIDEEDSQGSTGLGGLRGFGEVLMGYGERHFDGPVGQKNSKKGVWARVLLTCGSFERAVAALYDHQELQVEAVHLALSLAYYGLLRVSSRAESSDVDILTVSSTGATSINFPLLVSRYIRQFMKSDPKEALQYVYTICLNADQAGGGVGKEQVEAAWEMVRKIIVSSAESGGSWEELVGGFRADGSRFGGTIERDMFLLRLGSSAEYNEQILLRAAHQSERSKRTIEAIKLYHLAGAHSTVISCLAKALGEVVGEPPSIGADDGEMLDATARDILLHYERTNRAAGKEKDAVRRLVKVREAMSAKNAGRLEAALEAIESTQLIPLEGDIPTITRRADEFKEHDDAIARNLQTFLPLTMEILRGLHEQAKTSPSFGDAGRLARLAAIRKKARALMVFAGMLKYRMSPDVYSYLARLEVEISI